MNSKVSFVLFFYCITSSFAVFTQDTHVHEHHQAVKSITYIANQGQWNSNILFESHVENGSVYLEKNCLTFAQYSPTDLEKRDELYHTGTKEWKNLTVNGHAWKMNFVGANPNALVLGKDKRPEYHNYFIGNNQSKWQGNVGVYNAAEYQNLYPGIDLKTYSDDGHFKYDFIVKPNAEASNISLAYEGLDNVFLKDGNVVLKTSVGDFKEMKPYAYQLVNAKKVEVLCNYVLKGNTLTFEFPNDYNHSLELIIDPILVAATLSGTSFAGDNYGHAATFDNAGNIYTGAINFGAGYPATIGSFQVANGGGFTDIAISKLNPTGSTLIYATHLGGIGDENPHSLVVNSMGELFVLGTTSSSNFPVSVGAFDTNLSGFSDIIITHFTSNGTGIVGSTYIGGTLDDGQNNVTFNYGDTYRGEIILDATGNCYVATTTTSSNFPMTSGSYQTTFGGGFSDAVFFKMNGNLNSLVWSTYLGGSGDDSGFGLRLDQAGDIYACGATNGNIFTGTGYQVNSAGFDDGFIVKITNNGTSMPNRTYVGTPSDDNAFFIDIDINGKIYIYGQTSQGNMSTTAGVYSVAGSGQYINRFNATLTTREISTLIGGGSTDEFVPIAFMVDNCGYIYFSGHSSYSFLPVTANPLQTSGGFYIGVLAPDAASLHYATHYGGTGDHVDGGTSRFDPHGIVYQGVCTASGFNTTPTAYSSTYPGGWDIGVFKIDFQLNPLIASASFSSAGSGCAPVTVNFNNTSNGTSYIWDFGDGSPTSTAVSPSHTYNNTGNYTVMLIANSSTSCVTADTAYFTVSVPAQLSINLGPDLNLCTGTTVLDPGPIAGASYLWQNGSTNQTFTVSSAGLYYVTVTAGPCSATDSVNITYGNLIVDLGPNGTICSGGTTILDAGNPGSTYLWSDLSTNQTLNVSSSGTYWVTVTNATCSGSDTIQINLSTATPDFNVADTVGCSPLITHFTDLSVASSAISARLWNFGDGGISTLQNPNHQYTASGNYTVTLNITTADGCIESISKTVNILLYPTPIADFSFIPTQPQSGEEIFFTDESSNALNWTWDFGDGVTSTLQNPTHIYGEINDFDVTLLVENNGCFDSIQANISFGEPLIYYVPNAFTPDADGFNHVFQPIFTSGFSPYKYHLYIYNRWGELLFESLDHTAPWDGTYNGRICPQGAYTWKIDFGEEQTDKRHTVLGHVMLLK